MFSAGVRRTLGRSRNGQADLGTHSSDSPLVTGAAGARSRRLRLLERGDRRKPRDRDLDRRDSRSHLDAEAGRADAAARRRPGLESGAPWTCRAKRARKAYPRPGEAPRSRANGVRRGGDPGPVASHRDAPTDAGAPQARSPYKRRGRAHRDRSCAYGDSAAPTVASTASAVEPTPSFRRRAATRRSTDRLDRYSALAT